MSDRFGNVSTADLVTREIEALAEYEAVQAALKARMIAEMPIKLGRVYTVKTTGRKLWVLWANPERRWKVKGPYGPAWELMIGGHLENPRSTTGTGFNRKNYYTRVSNLEPIEGPEGEGQEDRK